MKYTECIREKSKYINYCNTKISIVLKNFITHLVTAFQEKCAIEISSPF